MRNRIRWRKYLSTLCMVVMIVSLAMPMLVSAAQMQGTEMTNADNEVVASEEMKAEVTESQVSTEIEKTDEQIESVQPEKELLQEYMETDIFTQESTIPVDAAAIGQESSIENVVSEQEISAETAAAEQEPTAEAVGTVSGGDVTLEVQESRETEETITEDSPIAEEPISEVPTVETFVFEEPVIESPAITTENQVAEPKAPVSETAAAETPEATQPTAADTQTTSEEESTYTDEQGNVFTYKLDEEGNAIITGITMGGDALTVPEVIEGISVVSVDNGGAAVLENPGVVIEELVINTPTIGARAFRNLSIGTLVIGDAVRSFSMIQDSNYDFYFYYEQFASCQIETFSFQAVELIMDQSLGEATDDFYGPFNGARINALEIGAGVTLIPELFLKDAKMTLDSLELNTRRIGAMAFFSPSISIDHLILGEGISCFEEFTRNDTLFHHWENFSDVKIGTLQLETPNLTLNKTIGIGDHASNTIYPPFQEAYIEQLIIGENVVRIPDYFLCESIMTLESLIINVPEVGAKAFASNRISIGELTIGTEVSTFTESYYSKDLFHHWNQFQSCRIGHLIYETPNLSIISDVAGISTSANFNGPFQNAVIDSFTLADMVTYIPNYLLKEAKVSIPELQLHISNIGAMAFNSVNISIDKLVLGEAVAVMEKAPSSNTTFHYWMQFAEAKIGELYYDVPSLELVDEVNFSNNGQGPFYKSKIGTLYLGEQVERIPGYCFIEASMSIEMLELHVRSIGRAAFASPYISFGTLTIGTEVEQFEGILSGNLTYYQQFEKNKITTLNYLPVDCQTGTAGYKGPFDQAKITAPVIDAAVQVIPNYLFLNSIMSFEDFTVYTSVIGYESFSSSSISFQKLTIAENVTGFPVNSSNQSKAFDKCTIELLCYNATEARVDKLANNVYGPFSYYTKIKEIEIGENVRHIPYGCFRDADMSIPELTLENLSVGYGAFMDRDVTIQNLTIGEGVTYDGMVSNRMSCFEYANIGTLNFNGNGVEVNWTNSTGTYGMFARATIGQLNIGENVKAIPALWFINAELVQDSLTISCDVGCYAFYSSDIEIGTLTLTGDVSEISYIGNVNAAFASNVIDTVIYDFPNASFQATSDTAYGLLYRTEITNFILSENVEYIDKRTFNGNTIENCYVYAVHGTETFNSQGFTGRLRPECTNLYIHYNSDFKPFFSKNVTEYHWLCVDYFDTSYGDKIYDEETGEYRMEIFKTCSVCGYEEIGTEELDNSYDMYLSIPVEIPLSFDAEAKAYSGSEQIYAYGTLGNAYEGLQVVVNREAENYGKAVKDEATYDITSYLSVTFTGREAAAFTPEQLTENAALAAAGTLEGLYQDSMDVSVDALAFVEGGVGNYRISIPVKIELMR